MTEAEWQRCRRPDLMMGHLQSVLSGRKALLFAVACGRAVWPLLRDAPTCEVIEAAEKIADGAITDKAFLESLAAAPPPPPQGRVADWTAWAVVRRSRGDVAIAVTHLLRTINPRGEANRAAPWSRRGYRAVVKALQELQKSEARSLDAPKVRTFVSFDDARGKVQSKQADMLRDLFNPFRTLSVGADVLSWNGGTVQNLAQGIYEERAFGRLPILADALLDAGCDDEAILAHCRSAGPHVRGCWAVDLILGKS